jgi:hypothetical protein
MMGWKKIKYNSEVSVLYVSRKFLLVMVLFGREKKNASSIYVGSKMMHWHKE